MLSLLGNMKKRTGTYRLSPNEEARLLKEETERRRKQRLIQVREQCRHNAARIRHDVQQEKQKQLNKFASEVQCQLNGEKEEKIQRLEEQYDSCLRSIGQGHSEAETQPDMEVLRAAMARQDAITADNRYKDALEKLHADQQEKFLEENKQLRARNLALEVERSRAMSIAQLPPPEPDPVNLIEPVKHKAVKMSGSGAFSTTYYHLNMAAAVEKASPAETLEDARDAAKEEEVRIEQQDEHRQMSLQDCRERARVRYEAAIEKELVKQDYNVLLHDLSDLQRADLQRRQRIVADIPKQVFVPPHRRLEEKEDRQLRMEQVFEDLYSKGTNNVGDISLALDPQPPPDTPTVTESLDLSTLSAPVTPLRDGESDGATLSRERNVGVAVNVPPLSPSKQPETVLKTLLTRIKSQRDTWETSHTQDIPDLQSARTENGKSSRLLGTQDKMDHHLIMQEKGAGGKSLSQHSIDSRHQQDDKAVRERTTLKPATAAQPNEDGGNLFVRAGLMGKPSQHDGMSAAILNQQAQLDVQKLELQKQIEELETYKNQLEAQQLQQLESDGKHPATATAYSITRAQQPSARESPKNSKENVPPEISTAPVNISAVSQQSLEKMGTFRSLQPSYSSDTSMEDKIRMYQQKVLERQQNTQKTLMETRTEIEHRHKELVEKYPQLHLSNPPLGTSLSKTDDVPDGVKAAVPILTKPSPKRLILSKPLPASDVNFDIDAVPIRKKLDFDIEDDDDEVISDKVTSKSNDSIGVAQSLSEVTRTRQEYFEKLQADLKRQLADVQRHKAELVLQGMKSRETASELLQSDAVQRPGMYEATSKGGTQTHDDSKSVPSLGTLIQSGLNQSALSDKSDEGNKQNMDASSVSGSSHSTWADILKPYRNEAAALSEATITDVSSMSESPPEVSKPPPVLTTLFTDPWLRPHELSMIQETETPGQSGASYQTHQSSSYSGDNRAKKSLDDRFAAMEQDDSVRRQELISQLAHNVPGGVAGQFLGSLNTGNSPAALSEGSIYSSEAALSTGTIPDSTPTGSTDQSDQSPSLNSESLVKTRYVIDKAITAVHNAQSALSHDQPAWPWQTDSISSTNTSTPSYTEHDQNHLSHDQSTYEALERFRRSRDPADQDSLVAVSNSQLQDDAEMLSSSDASEIMRRSEDINQISYFLQQRDVSSSPANSSSSINNSQKYFKLPSEDPTLNNNSNASGQISVQQTLAPDSASSSRFFKLVSDNATPDVQSKSDGRSPQRYKTPVLKEKLTSDLHDLSEGSFSSRSYVSSITNANRKKDTPSYFQAQHNLVYAERPGTASSAISSARSLTWSELLSSRPSDSTAYISLPDEVDAETVEKVLKTRAVDTAHHAPAHQSPHVGDMDTGANKTPVYSPYHSSAYQTSERSPSRFVVSCTPTRQTPLSERKITESNQHPHSPYRSEKKTPSRIPGAVLTPSKRLPVVDRTGAKTPPRHTPVGGTKLAYTPSSPRTPTRQSTTAVNKNRTPLRERNQLCDIVRDKASWDSPKKAKVFKPDVKASKKTEALMKDVEQERKLLLTHEHIEAASLDIKQLLLEEHGISDDPEITLVSNASDTSRLQDPIADASWMIAVEHHHDAANDTRISESLTSFEQHESLTSFEQHESSLAEESSLNVASARKEPTGASLQQAFLNKRKKFISASAQRLTQAKGKASTNTALPFSATLAQWKKSKALTTVKDPPRSPRATVQSKAPGPIIEKDAEIRKQDVKEILERNTRLYSQLEEVKQQKECQERQTQYAQNREKAKEYHKKLQERLKKQRIKKK